VLLEGGHQKVKITDFGLARTADDASISPSISQSGIIAGTPMYMAPEQAHVQTLDQRADLFSLGSVLYQMVAGRPPFRANSAVAVLKRVAEDQPRAIREIIPETPQWLCDIIAKLHAKNLDDRYQSAREVADVLADCEAQLKANARLKDYSRIPRSKPRRFGRRKWVAAVALLAVIGVALTWWRGWVNEFFAPRSPVADSGASRGTPQAPSAPPLTVAPFDAAKAKELQEAWARHLGVPVEVTDVAGMKMRLIPPGEFLMGTPEADLPALLTEKDAYWRDIFKNESPPQRVRLTRPYRIGATEVTLGQFRRFVQATGYKTDVERGVCQGVGLVDGQHVRGAKFTWDADVGLGGGDDAAAVVDVTWYDAQQFCAWLSNATGRSYRLPTEAEWEYACRAGTDTPYYTGEGEDALEKAGWYSGNSGGRTHPVGQLAANAWGLYDMHGGVWEWCQNCYANAARRSGLLIDPTGRGVGPVRRGGGWFSTQLLNRSAAREPLGSYAHCSFCQGFRVVMVGDLSPAAEGKQAPRPAFTDADVKRIAALPAEQQVEEVRKELMRLNPGFDGKAEHKIEDGVVTEFKIVTDKVTDIAPIRVFNALRVLECRGTYSNKPNGLLADLTPLEGMNLAGLTHLNLGYTKVTDAGIVYFKDCKDLTALYLNHTKVSDQGLAHFKDCKNLASLRLDATQVGDAGLIHFHDCKDLTFLNLSWNKVSDAGLAHFKDSKNLTHLHFDNTQVGDAGLAYFKGVRLTVLSIDHTGITDLTPLQGMLLEEIRLTPKNITKGLDILRDMKSLKSIGIDWDQFWPAAEFWERYDKGEFKE
jgi:formylglycine-generating enzyme required for sulfatase activity